MLTGRNVRLSNLLISAWHRVHKFGNGRENGRRSGRTDT